MKKTVKLLFFFGLSTLVGIGFICTAWAQTRMATTAGGTENRAGTGAGTFRRIANAVAAAGTGLEYIAPGGAAAAGTGLEYIAPGGAAAGTQGDQVTLGGANQGTQATLTASSAAQPAVTLTNAPTQTGTVPAGGETAGTQTAGTMISFDALINDYTAKGIAASTKFMELYNNAINQMKTDMQNANGSEEMLAIYNTMQDTISQARDTFSAELTQIQNEFTQGMNTQRDEIIKNFNAISAVQ